MIKAVFKKQNNIDELDDAPERKKAHVDRHHHLAACAKGIKADMADAGRAVQNNKIILPLQGLHGPEQGVLPAGPVGKLMLHRAQNHAGRGKIEIVVDGQDDILQLKAVGVAGRQHLIQAFFLVGVHLEAHGCMGLGVTVDKQHPLLSPGKGR